MKPKLARAASPNGDDIREQFYCPGCKCGHAYRVPLSDPTKGPVWEWNGNREAPTFTPSLLMTSPRGANEYRCHLFIASGMIQFCGDCSHDLKGQTVPMVEWPENYYVTHNGVE